eukprot:352850-Chlamydomonas_euryale.AAC.8
MLGALFCGAQHPSRPQETKRLTCILAKHQALGGLNVPSRDLPPVVLGQNGKLNAATPAGWKGDALDQRPSPTIFHARLRSLPLQTIAPVGPVHNPVAICDVAHSQENFAELLGIRRDLSRNHPVKQRA